MQRDKLKHLLVGIGISLVFGVQFSPLIGLLIATIVGALKEIMWDWLLKRGTPELMDFLATALGGAISYMAIKLILGG